jgi:hypothetical protein
LSLEDWKISFTFKQNKVIWKKSLNTCLKTSEKKSY